MTKQLFVSSAVQAALMSQVLIPQMKDGFWKNHRPADHHREWADVQIIVSTDGVLGPVNFKVPRLYNFVNSEFIKAAQDDLIKAAQDVKPASNFRSVKKELIELSRIVGGRLNDKSGIVTKANRGNVRPAHDTSALVQNARDALAAVAAKVKRTAVKRPAGEVEVIKTSSGATVRRVAVAKI